jgi:hypothetical protein
MIEQDGWETVFVTGLRVMREETDAEFRARIEATYRRVSHRDFVLQRKLVPVEPLLIESESARARAFRDSWPPAMIQLGRFGEVHTKQVVPARISFPPADDE